MGRTLVKKEINRKTTFWDFLIALGSGIVNLLKIEKIICIVILYVLFRDIYFLRHFSDGDVYRKYLIDTNILVQLLNSGNDKIYVTIIICLIIICIILLCVIRFVYVKEINRLAEERSRMMHDLALGNFRPLKVHSSSEKERR